ncbi:hypothetical protein KC19_VG189600 [Ceratodon purpureus]|uniref:Uncharacterized protein n=1 Tax=Ceratodon purpureus TaxID=3225 RepID=A0A8T0HRI6_CERPU|nr:hypothetical protein KC19_VG189600 [Ceratodon purpureus]
MSRRDESGLDDEGTPLLHGQGNSDNNAEDSGVPTLVGLRVPDKFQYPWDATFIWNGRNHRHLCNSCRCIYCTALRWVVLPHCKCRLPGLSEGLPLDVRIRAKRR